MPQVRPTGSTAVALLLALTAGGPALAADRFWDVNQTGGGSGGTGTWDTSSFYWSPNGDGVSGPYNQAWSNTGIIPGTPDSAVFGGTAGTVTLGGPTTVNNMTFNVTGYTLEGSALTFGGPTPTISAISGTTTINSILAGSNGLTKTGAGILALNGNNSFSGGINVNGGRLIVSGNAALGASSNIINMANGTRLDAGTTGGSLAGRTITLSGSVSVAGAGVGSAYFTGTGGLVLSAGALNNDSNDYTGTTGFFGGTASSFTSIADLGIASSLGAPTTVANGTITISSSGQTNAVVDYLGDGDTSNRNWQINPPPGPSGEAAYLRNRGTGTLTLTGSIALGGGSGNRAEFDAMTADMELLGVISSNIARDAWFVANAGRTVRLGDANTFTGRAVIRGAGQVEAGTIADGGVASSLGAGAVINISAGGTLSYTGAGAATDRSWQMHGGALNNDGTGALTLNGPVNLLNTATLGGSFTGAANTIAGVIDGTGNLRSGGDATWVLAGTNTYTGSTIVDGGTLRAGSANAFGGSTVFVVNGGTLDLNGFDRTLSSFSGTGGEMALNGGAELTINSSGTTSTTFSGSITGDGGLIKAGSVTSTLTLTGQSAYTGDTTIQAGTLALSFVGAGGPTSDIISGASTLNMTGGIVTVTGVSGEGNSQSFDGLNVSVGSNRITATNATVNFGAINRTGGLIDFGVGTGASFTTTNADGNLGGWATVTTGSITDYAKISGGNVVAFTAADYVNKDDAATWTVNGEFISDEGGAANTAYFGTVGSSVQLGGLRYSAAQNSTVTIAAGQTLGVDGTIIVASSAGNTAKTIQGGQLTGASGGALGILHNGTGTFVVASTIVDNGGATGFTKAGAGTVNLTGTNSYTGATTLSGGTLSIGTIANGGVDSAIGASSNASSNLVLENGRLFYSGATVTTDRGFTLINGGPERVIEVQNAGADLTFTGLVTSPDGAGLTKRGAGTLTLANGANDYAGATRIDGGVLSVGTLADGGIASSIGNSDSSSSNLVLTTGGTLRYTGDTRSSNRGFTLAGGIGGIDVFQAGTELTLSGTAVGAGALVKSGDGVLVLSGTNTYTGGNTVSAGTLRAGSNQAFGGAANGAGAGAVTVAAGATLDVNAYSVFVGGLNGAGNVTMASPGAVKINNSGTFSGAISGTGSLEVRGGTQTMVGCGNTYTGATTISAGTLRVDCIGNGGAASGIGASSAAASNLVITSSGTLAYTGGTVTSDRGFHLAAGWGVVNVSQTATTLEFTGNVTNAAGGGLKKMGAGTLTLSGTNTYGGTWVNEGTLVAGSAQAFGSSTMTINAGALVDMTRFSNTVSALDDNNTAGGEIRIADKTLTLNGGSAIFAGRITGTTGSLVKNGGTQVLTGCDNTYGGSTTINAGWISVACLADGGLNSSIGSSSSDASNLVIGNGGVLNYTGEGDSTNRRFTLAGTPTYVRNNGTGAVAFTNTAAVTYSGVGTRQLRLGGANTATNVMAAQIGNNGASATSVVKEEAGTWRLTSSTSTYTGATTISDGVLEVVKLADGQQASSIGAATAAAGNLVIGINGHLRYVGSGDSTNRLFTLGNGTTYIESSGTGAINFTDSGGLMGFAGTGPRTLALGGTYAGDNIMGVTIRDQSATTGKTTLAKNDAGNWILTANNTYTGNTVINAGKLIIGNGGTIGNVGTGEVILAFSSGVLGFNRSDAFTFAGKISGPGTIEQMGEGTTILTAVNSAGSTKISEGTLQVNGDLTTDTIVFDDDETTTLTLNGAVHGAGGAPATITGDGSANIININAGGLLAANGDLGGGSDVVTVSGTLATGASQLNLGAGNDTLVLNDTAVFTGAGVNGGAGTGDILRVNNSSARTLVGSSVVGFESLTKTLGGALTLTGSHSFGTGTNVDGGSLIVDGTLGSGAVTVASGATLGGNGTITGPVAIVNGATLAPGSAGNVPGTLTVAGNLTLNGGSTLAYDFGQANTVGGALNDHTLVTGNLRLDGTLNMTVSSGGTFAPGFYRVFTYGGTLDNQGLTLGPSVPSGVAVDTSSGGQVNLLSTGGLTLNFWDGGAAGNHFDDVAEGGNGVWQSAGGNVNWTDMPANGEGVNASWTDAGFAIFQGSAGTVTVDNAPATVATAGMQFRTSGYVIDGEPLTLVSLGSGNAVIRVGEGAATDASITATIAAELTGATGLIKTDGGRLILAAANSYTGETVIAGGTIQVAAESALGANGTLALQGGALNTTSSFSLGKDISLQGPGGSLDVNDGTTLTEQGTINGPGVLVKAGAGTLVLAGSNTYSGGTSFNGGVVSISAAANLGTGPLTFNGGTLQSSGLVALAMGGTINAAGGTIDTLPGTLTIAGNLAGAGALTKTGSGLLTLTGSNSYGGGTTIAGGSLQLGNGSASGSITGNVANRDQLLFNRSDAYAFDGVISGTGSVVQIGSGTTILTGTNTYLGITDVADGTLLVNGNQSGATGASRVRLGATLGGTGTIGGDVTVNFGGTLAPGDGGNAPGTLTINGDLTLESGASLAYNFGQPNIVGGPNNDHAIVAGDLDMQGAKLDISITPSGTFGPGIYRVITYGGDLLNDQLTLGVVPNPDLAIDTSIDHQVNLVNRFGATLTYWDGAGSAGNGAINGGDGIWQNQDLASNINWTDSPSTLNGRWTDEAFAIFQGNAGTVQVDNSNGAVTASGMQFLVDGYEITGQPLTLVPWSSGTNAIIRVGSGAIDDASLTTTISAELTGAAGLTKTDGGRLVLTAANSYTGETVIEGGVIEVAAEAALGANSGLVLQGGTLNTTTSFTLGKDISLELPGGALDVDGGTTLELAGTLGGPGALVKTGMGTLLQSIAGADTHAGVTTVAQGTLLAGKANVLSAVSAYRVDESATLDLDGFNQTIASLDNAGNVRIDGAAGTVLTITGDYVGSGGTVYLNAVLGDDASPTDRLVVGGNTSGNSILAVSNVGGAGAPTVQGIKLVDVAGTSAATFTLQGDYVFEGDQAVVGGAYAYRLYHNGVTNPDGDWYLRSSLIEEEPLYQAGVPLYEAYANVLQSFQKLETLQQRVGNRSWQLGTGVVDAGEDIEDGALWGRIVADRKGITPDISTAGITHDVTNWRIEAGAVSTLSETESGKLVGGLTAFLGTTSAAVSSVYGDGSISSLGYGLGAGLTYYGSGGFYLDGQARVTGFDSTLSSATAGLDLVDGNKGFGYALSLEAGQKVVATDQFSLTPQAQLAYSSVQFDDFTDTFGALVSLSDGDSLVARIGLSADFEDKWENEAGESGRNHVYGIANLYYELLEGSDVDVAGTGFANKTDPLWGGVGIGGSINWAGDKYSIYGEVLANTGLGAIGESYSLGATGGMRVKW